VVLALRHRLGKPREEEESLMGAQPKAQQANSVCVPFPGHCKLGRLKVSEVAPLSADTYFKREHPSFARKMRKKRCLC